MKSFIAKFINHLRGKKTEADPSPKCRTDIAEPKSGNSGGRPPLEVDLAAAYRLRCEGVSDREIARKLNVSKDTIGRRLRDYQPPVQEPAVEPVLDWSTAGPLTRERCEAELKRMQTTCYTAGKIKAAEPPSATPALRRTVEKTTEPAPVRPEPLQSQQPPSQVTVETPKLVPASLVWPDYLQDAIRPIESPEPAKPATPAIDDSPKRFEWDETRQKDIRLRKAIAAADPRVQTKANPPAEFDAEKFISECADHKFCGCYACKQLHCHGWNQLDGKSIEVSTILQRPA